ncbi:N-formylglutamate amidohydrolase [Mesorhizobium sp. 10J20-29]
MLHSFQTDTAILSSLDPDPVETVNSEGTSDFVIICEHAGRMVPALLGDLGVSPEDMSRHIAYDVGAAGLARQLSALLDAPLILQRYSRLVVDCNRPLDAQDCFPEISDGTAIPANVGLTDSERRSRFAEIHQPFHAAIAGLLDRRATLSKPAKLIAVHSFTPRLTDGPERPWHVGALSNRDPSFADMFLASFRAKNPEVLAASNEPYIVDDLSDYTIPVHGERRGLPHVLLEIRNDLISTESDQDRWARIVAASLFTLSQATMKAPSNVR